MTTSTESLKNFRVAVLATDGFEESELTEPVKALRSEGADVEIVSLRMGEIQGFKHFDRGQLVRVDRSIDSVHAADYDGLLLPGGALNADRLRSEPKILSFVKQISESGKPMAVICHAPWILISAGVANDRIMTSYHTIRDDLKNAGVHYVDQQVVLDHDLVTSRQPSDIPAFNREMLHLFGKFNSSIINIAESA